MEMRTGVRCRKWQSPGYVQSGSVCVFLYDLGGNVERIFMQLESGIELGGAASPRENRIQSGLDVLEKQIAWKLSSFPRSWVKGFIRLRPGQERFHRKHRDCIWPQAECHPSAVSLQSSQMSCGHVWTVRVFSFGGNPPLLCTAEGSAEGFGLLWHQFHENGLIRESPVRTDRNNPRSWS